MKSRIISGIVIVAVIALAEPVSASFTGVVRDNDGNPVAGAVVRFTEEIDYGISYSTTTDIDGRYTLDMTVGVAEDAAVQPPMVELFQNYPNPFNPATSIPFTVETAGIVNLSIYNIMGQKVRTLVNEHRSTGLHSVMWDGRDGAGNGVAAGVYLYRLVSGEYSEARKMLLIDGGGVTAGTTSRSYLPHASAKRADGSTFLVSITGDDIVDYEESGVTVVNGGIYDFIVHAVIGISFVGIPGGTFEMGSNFEDDPENPYPGRGKFEDEKPVHTVTVSGFEMSIHEVTNAQYAAYLAEALASGDITVTSFIVTGASGEWNGKEYFYLYKHYDVENSMISYKDGIFLIDSGTDNRPVQSVSWYGAKAFAEYYGFDLPTEAEWEYACRGGQQYQYGTIDGTIDISKVNYGGYANIGHTTDVGSYPPNPFGLYDMSGNIAERCLDWYDSGYYGSSTTTDPNGPTTGTRRVVRGGWWGDDYTNCRSSNRLSSYPTSGGSGFRVVRRP